MRGGVVLGLAVLASAPAALAQDKLDNLLKELVPTATAPAGRVEVTGWLETTPGGSELVVRLVPEGAAKLVADPGLTVTPLGPDGSAGEAVALVDPSRDYLTEPPEVRVPLPGPPAGPVKARVDYAYCLVNYVCLFGESTISVDSSSAGGGAG